MAKIPVTLITGFLGAGKTTLVNEFLKQTKEKIALIINEFGDISIDNRLITTETEELIELASGSICCSVKDDLMKILSTLLATGKHLDRVVIETTGLADPIPLLEAFAKRPMLYQSYEVTQVITVIDAFHIAEQLQMHEEAIPQIAIADILLINKIDLVNDVAEIEELLRRINPIAHILTANKSKVPIEELLQGYVPDRFATISTGSEDHEHSSNIETIVLREDRPLDLQKVGLFIAEQILLNADNFVRYKGILNIEGMEDRFVFQGVHTQFENRRDRPWGEKEERVSEVVLIGRDLDAAELTRAFAQCI
jgi:G3E family GTPase